MGSNLCLIYKLPGNKSTWIHVQAEKIKCRHRTWNYIVYLLRSGWWMQHLSGRSLTLRESRWSLPFRKRWVLKFPYGMGKVCSLKLMKTKDLYDNYCNEMIRKPNFSPFKFSGHCGWDIAWWTWQPVEDVSCLTICYAYLCMNSCLLHLSGSLRPVW